MSADRWQRMEELFNEALQRPASERASFLATAVSGDDNLRAEVERLLATYTEASEFLEPDSPERAEILRSIEDTLAIGSSLGHYRIEELLGGGGMGIVYRARDTRQDIDVAIKILRHEALADPAARKRFAQEGRAAAALDHPSIVRVREVGHEDGVDFLVMEFVNGRTLSALIEAGPLPCRDAVRYACEVASALEAAHASGVIHRDVKPGNIMITADGAVKVLDFGLCQQSAGGVPSGSTVHTQAGMLLGTVAYMSPEQAQGLPTDERSDIFSFGALLYEMLTGRQAFAEPTTVATLAAILHQEPRLDSRIPTEVQPLLARCLAKKPEARFQTATALETALRGLDRALGAGPLNRMLLRARTVIWRQRSRWVRWGLIGVGLAAAFWLGWLAFNRISRAPLRAILTPDSALSFDPAVSRDGTLLAYASDRAGEGTLDIWLQPLPKGQPIRLVHSAIDAREPNFSPDGTTIAFRLEREGGEICVVSTAGGGLKRIAPLGRRPRFSPDGKWIAYWTGPEGSSDLFSPGVSHAYIVPAGGGAPKLMAPELPAAAYPVWTPDSSAVLIPASVDARPGLQGVGVWVAPVDGGPARQGISAARFHEWKVNGKSAALNLFNDFAFPVAMSRNGGLIIPAPFELRTEIWEFPLTPRSWTSSGPPRLLSTITDLTGFPAFDADGNMFIEELTRLSTSLWEVPVDFSGAKPSGPPRQLVSCPRNICLPFVSRDGNKVLFSFNRQDSWSLGLTIRDLQSGRETALAGSGVDYYAALTADGKSAFYYELSEETVNRPARLYRVNTTGGPAEVVCQACPRLWDVSADGRYILGSDFKPRQVVLVDLATGAQTSLLRHAALSLYHARFSTDGKWIAFTARGGAPGTRIFVAPFHPGREHAFAERIEITPGQNQDGPVAWSPRGDALYFASERDGNRCLWIQRLNPATKFPLGEPEPFQHFHEARVSLKNIASSQFSFSIGRDKIVYPLGERTGRIWMTR